MAIFSASTNAGQAARDRNPCRQIRSIRVCRAFSCGCGRGQLSTRPQACLAAWNVHPPRSAVAAKSYNSRSNALRGAASDSVIWTVGAEQGPYGSRSILSRHQCCRAFDRTPEAYPSRHVESPGVLCEGGERLMNTTSCLNTHRATLRLHGGWLRTAMHKEKKAPEWLMESNSCAELAARAARPRSQGSKVLKNTELDNARARSIGRGLAAAVENPWKGKMLKPRQSATHLDSSAAWRIPRWRCSPCASKSPPSSAHGPDRSR